jgi:cytochrome c oxidase subunit 2
MTAPLSRCLVATALLLAAAGARPAPAGPPLVVTITAHRFEFAPAEVSLERGRPVILRLTSQDVIHGFFSKELGIDELIEPNKVLEVPLTPAQAGRFTIICDHFCGAGHGNMKLTLVVR